MAYVIKWQCQNSGKTGQGNPTSDRKVAESWADEMNKKYPEIDHWVEEVSYAKEKVEGDCGR